MSLSRWTPARVASRSAASCFEALARACLFVLALTVTAHFLLGGHADPQRCGALLSHGSWPAHDTLASWRDWFDRWEPRGCRMHEYSRDDFSDCLAGRRLVFVGDSTMRQLFLAAAKRLDPVRADEERMRAFVSDNPRHDIDVAIHGVRFIFIYDPWLNSTGLAQELGDFRPGPGGDSSGSAALLMVGAPGLWAARNGGDDYLDLFQRGIDTVRPYLADPIEPASASPDVSYRDLKNHVLIAPVQVPRYRKLSPARAEVLTPSKIREMNGYLASLPRPASSRVVFAYNQMTRPGTRRAFEDTGLHVREALTERKIDIALNLRCNQGLVRRQPHVNRETCCVSYPTLARGQRLALFILAISALPVAFSLLLALRGASLSRGLSSSDGHLRQALGVISVVVLYCYTADRTQLFPKAGKRLSITGLVTGLGTVAALSAFSLRKRGQTRGQNSAGRNKPASTATLALRSSGSSARAMPGSPQYNENTVFLPREVSDEWKGWMQALVLMLSFQELSDQPWAYKLFRLISAAYLFICTYGHAMYLLRTCDYSLRRVATVVWRLNALPFIVSMAVGSDGTLYHFPRLASFWFFITWLTLRIGWRRFNGSPSILILKVFAAAFFTTVLFSSRAPFGFLGRVLATMAPGIIYNADVVLWELSMDRFVPHLGLLFAVLTYRANVIKLAYARRQVAQAHIRSPLPGTPMSVPGQPRPKLLRERGPPAAAAMAAAGSNNTVDWALASFLFPDEALAPIYPGLLALAFLNIPLFFLETQLSSGWFQDRALYDAVHPYISCAPVATYALLRGGSYAPMRRAHLALPAALGRVALESHVLHRHVWLAGDGSGLLRIGLAWSRGVPAGGPVRPGAHGGGGGGGGWIAQTGWRLETLVVTVVFLWVCWRARTAAETLGRWALGGGGGGGDNHSAPLPDGDLESGSDGADGRSYRLDTLDPGLPGLREPSPARYRHEHQPGQLRKDHPGDQQGAGRAKGLRQDPRLRVAVLLLVAWVSNLIYK
ncbi:hypothetical protein RB601_003335 [Gaeumannomyces tritici]